MKKIISILSISAISITLLGACTTKKVQEKVEKKEIVLYIARHGKTMLNTTDRVQGWSDAVLTKAGEEGAEALGRGLKDIKFDAVYSSDSGRSVQTANIVLKESEQTNLKLVTDPKLREFNFGTYEGELNEVMWTEIAALHGKSLEEWKEEFSPKEFADSVAQLDVGKDPKNLNWPAENYDQITKRLKESIEEIVKNAQTNNQGNILVVSHGLSINAIIDIFNTDDSFKAIPVANSSITKITYKDGTYKIEEVGELKYLEAGKNK